MPKIRRNTLDEQQVKNLWMQFNNESKSCFQSFPEAIRKADAACEGRCKYGSQCVNAEHIGEWGQEFWDALPDSPSIRKDEFFRIRDIAEWWCFGD